jgi:hypothetical protein
MLFSWVTRIRLLCKIERRYSRLDKVLLRHSELTDDIIGQNFGLMLHVG